MKFILSILITFVILFLANYVGKRVQDEDNSNIGNIVGNTCLGLLLLIGLSLIILLITFATYKFL